LRNRIGKGSPEARETDGVGIGMILDACDGTYSSKVGDHKVSWVSCGVCRRLGPLLPGGDGGKDAGRGETGRVSRDSVSDTKDSVSTICLRKGC